MQTCSTSNWIFGGLARGLPGRIAIARKHPDARRAADVVAVVTPAALAHLLETDEELLWLDSN